MDALRNVTGEGAQCRYEVAVYYANGSVALLDGSPDTGYHVRDKMTVGELIAAEPDGWTWLTFMHECALDGYLALAGETSWGGAGFIALRRAESGEFLWVIHLSNCNNFESICTQSGVIIAVSDFHPQGTRFVIPLDAPENIQIVRRR